MVVKELGYFLDISTRNKEVNRKPDFSSSALSYSNSFRDPLFFFYKKERRKKNPTKSQELPIFKQHSSIYQMGQSSSTNIGQQAFAPSALILFSLK